MKTSGSPLRVLVIDDSEISRDVIRSLLEAAGWEIRTLDSPLGATAEVARFDPAVIVVDMNMPVMSGGRFVELLRRNPRLSQVKIVMVSGETEAELHRIGSGLEVDAILPKRSIDERLVRTIHGLVGAAPERGSTPSSSAGKGLVFVLDQDTARASEIKARLERLGYSVSHRRGGRGILVTVLLEKPVFVLIAPQLQDMSGKMVAELFRENRDTDKIPVILLGEGHESELAAEAIRWGVRGYVPRATDDAGLQQRLQRMITNR